MIDLRSDTVTQPDARMRAAMVDAAMGDDVFGEDPTAIELQHRVAELLGKEDALFVPSGMMGNQVAIKVLTHPGDEVLLDRTSHIFHYEAGAPGLLSGVQLHVVDGDQGILTPDHLRSAIRPAAPWHAPPRLVCLENTINRAGGRVYPLGTLCATAECAREHGLNLHLDGARLWNASVATDIPERTYAAPFDTVSVCLSKGLGAPVGSILAGSAELINAARRYRRIFGGGMRQIGMLAAAGLYALDHHREELVLDHEKARRLGHAIADLDAFSIDPTSVATNIVLFDTPGRKATAVLETLVEDGVHMVPFGPHTIRAVTHRNVSWEDVDRAIDILRSRFGPPRCMP